MRICELGTDGWYCVTKGKIRLGFPFVLSGELQSRTKVVGKVVQLNSISAALTQLLLMFNKNSFSSKYPPSPLFQCWNIT